MLVECGMFQGPKSLRTLNYRPLPFDVSAIGATVLSHAHIDHTGLFPKLVKAGFAGKAWTTEPTRDLLRWLLPMPAPSGERRGAPQPAQQPPRRAF